MTCDLQLVSAFLDDELLPSERIAVAEHIASCVRCTGVLLAYRRISSGLKAVPTKAPPASLDAGVYARLEESVYGRASARRLGSAFQGLVAVAFAAVLVLAMSALFRSYYRAGPYEHGAIVADEVVESAATTAPPSMTVVPALSGSVSAGLTARVNPDEGTSVVSTLPYATQQGERDSNSAPRSASSTQVAEVPHGAAGPILGTSGEAGGTQSRPRLVPTAFVTPASKDRPLQTLAAAPTSTATPASVPTRIVASLEASERPVMMVPTKTTAELAGAATPLSSVVDAEPSLPIAMEPTALALAAGGVAGHGVSAASAAAVPPAAEAVPAGDSTGIAQGAVADLDQGIVQRTDEHPSTLPSTPLEAKCLGSFAGSFGQLYEADHDISWRLDCGISFERPISVTEQAFERGYIFRLADDGEYYVLASDTGVWSHYGDRVVEKVPSDIPLAPSPDRMAPARSLAGLWRGSPTVSDVVGWGVSAGRTFNARVQVFRRGIMLWSDRRVVYVLYADGTWQDFPEPTVPQLTGR